MLYSEYTRISQEGSKHHDEGRLAEAAKCFASLVESDISDIDRSLMACNVALIHDKMGDTDGALAWYDQAIYFEQPYCRGYAAERKAAYLAEKGRTADSLALYEWLMDQPFSTEAEKERFWANINMLKNPRR